MNLMMHYNFPDKELFGARKENYSSFEIMSQILPPLSYKFKNGMFDDAEDFKTSNNVVEIIAGKMMRGQFDKGIFGSGAKGMLQNIFNDFGFEACADFIDNLQNIVTEYMKLTGYSVGISDLIADQETNDNIAKAITGKKQEVKDLLDQIKLGVFENTSGRSNRDEFESKVNDILNNARKDAGKIGLKSLSEQNRFVNMVKAGSKGGELNIAQMISCLGQQNVDNKRIPYGLDGRTLPHFSKFDDSPEARGFVESSFIQGLTPQELFFHAMGGRVGLIDTAVKTSQTGYIQRRLIKGMEDLKVEYDMSVRNSKNKIVQFRYGEDGIDTTKTENQFLPLADMSLHEIYGYFQMPEDETTDSVYKTNYTMDAIKRIKKQKKELLQKTEETIDMMIESRDVIVEKMYNYENRDGKIHIPVHFQRIIKNVKEQLNIGSNSFVDITPLECFKMIDAAMGKLEKIRSCVPTDLFRVTYYYYLCPKELLMTHRLHKDGVSMVLEQVMLAYKKAIVAPGEMVGMIAAQSIGEPTTQMTLNTFHHAGISSKSNVTRGVPRIEEILKLTDNTKNPSTTIFLRPEDQMNQKKAQQMMHSIEHTKLRDIVTCVSICFDPDNMATLIDEDKELMQQFNTFEAMLREAAEADEEDEPKSKWIIRIELNKVEMLDRNITMDDVHFALENGYKNSMQVVYSDYNSDNLVIRIRLMEILQKKKIDTTLDQSDEIYLLKNVQENLLDNVILKGIKGIGKVNIRKIAGAYVKEDEKYASKDIWVLDTTGSNLQDILAMDSIDKKRTYSNDVMEIYNVLGIEAARQAIYNEISEVIEFDGTYINSHHIGLLSDRMCANRKLVSIFRHGINNDDIGPIAKASFEETPEMFLRAARYAEMDHMRGVSSNVMTGQRGNYGTSAFNVILDMEKVIKMKEKQLAKEVNIDKEFDIEDDKDFCAIQTIDVKTNVEQIAQQDMADDDEYNPGF
jgi:DNA-directed RNA polymerase II subunit RPB1